MIFLYGGRDAYCNASFSSTNDLIIFILFMEEPEDEQRQTGTQRPKKNHSKILCQFYCIILNIFDNSVSVYRECRSLKTYELGHFVQWNIDNSCVLPLSMATRRTLATHCANHILTTSYKSSKSCSSSFITHKSRDSQVYDVAQVIWSSVSHQGHR